MLECDVSSENCFQMKKWQRKQEKIFSDLLLLIAFCLKCGDVINMEFFYK